MLGDLEDRIEARLAELRQYLPRLRLDSYGGELSDPDLLPGLLKGGPAVLLTVPRMRFTRRSNRRYALVVTFRLVIACRQPRNERASRRGNEADRLDGLGSYALWEACVRQLTGWQPWADHPGIVPTEFNNLVNGRFQGEHYSVLGQSFSLEAGWDIPDEPEALFDAIDLHYHLPPDADESAATDRIDLGDP
ncbi:phage protein Gp37 [Pseudomonas aeruginosa]|uniref:phage protein Gp37 n=1 Tax=Pseudomonas aeruginosa TaxID=287 RepID=UPI000BB981A6|nr:phage protein Gp37 [Pseudomonas aeruginosa]ELC7283656.1 DUF1834 family protein [Pseudomonas aeruginosa]ELN9531513.1 DUF1834 family protein [Pseudomonas aeruginosa]MBX6105064.1 DUF1834 family protein [Pseudomonas aeruginosa]MDP5434931.1 DUF1834 family protein [Pseudomonas aeruginosa]NQB52193.1 DUF1834 family protein [Pseudomonas aeruginosa]